MKATSTISRLLLGLVFTVFGLNGFLNFFSTGPVPPTRRAVPRSPGSSHALYRLPFWSSRLFLCRRAPALLLNRMTPLALTLLGPVIFNILLFHITMAPAGLPPAVFVAILWLVAAYRVREAFAGLFESGPAERLEASTCGPRPDATLLKGRCLSG